MTAAFIVFVVATIVGAVEGARSRSLLAFAVALIALGLAIGAYQG